MRTHLAGRSRDCALSWFPGWMRQYRSEGATVSAYESEQNGEDSFIRRQTTFSKGYATPELAAEAAAELQDAYDQGYRDARKAFIGHLDSGAYTPQRRDGYDEYEEY